MRIYATGTIGMNAAKYILAGGLAVVGPDKPAVVNGGESVSYGDLAVRVSRFAAALRDAGMKPGDRVAMLMYDHADLVWNCSAPYRWASRCLTRR
jgi:acyl-coenzyme A synthetase/AMP-(fatty) acid ligase